MQKLVKLLLNTMQNSKKLKFKKKTLKLVLVIFLSTTYLLSGWPSLRHLKIPKVIKEAQAAFPSVAATNNGNSAASVTTHTINLPTGITTGNLLIACVSVDGTPTLTWNTEAGTWTVLSGPASNESVLECRYKIATGSEGASFTVTSSVAEASAHVSYLITGQHTSSVPESVTPATGSDANPNPPLINPSGWDVEDTLWIVAIGVDSNKTISSYPTNFTSNQVFDQYNHSIHGAGIALASRNNAAASEDPGTATLSGTDGWVASTIAIRPATPVPILTQNDFEFWEDSTSLVPTEIWGNPNISENTALLSVPKTNDPIDPSDEIRFRMNISVTNIDLTSGSEGFILAYSEAQDCTTASSWTDVDTAGGSGVWRFSSDTDITDGTTLTTLLISTSDTAGRYSRSDPTSTNPNTVTAGTEMEWDWHIQYNGSATAATYCFRIERDDGTTLSGYNSDSYPRVDIRPGLGNFMRHGSFVSSGAERGFFWTD